MQEHFIDRALYYSSRAIITQGQKGEWDYELMPVYTICFLNFEDAHLKSASSVQTLYWLTATQDRLLPTTCALFI